MKDPTFIVVTPLVTFSNTSGSTLYGGFNGYIINYSVLHLIQCMYNVRYVPYVLSLKCPLLWSRVTCNA